MEEKEKNIEPKEKKNNNKKKLTLKQMIGIGVGILILAAIVSILLSKEGNVTIEVKNSLEKLIEKAELQTATFTYNVIAKECKKDEKCDKNSNNINDFKFVVSCSGTVTAQIDFNNDKIKINVDENNKKIIIELPEAKLNKPKITSRKFLNGEDLLASETANAENLCNETIKEKSQKDKKILAMAKEQAKVVLKSFYEKSKEALAKEYEIEVK